MFNPIAFTFGYAVFGFLLVLVGAAFALGTTNYRFWHKVMNAGLFVVISGWFATMLAAYFTK